LHAPYTKQRRLINAWVTPYGVIRSDIDVHDDNPPSAGSPTETLLRLLLPLSDKIATTASALQLPAPLRPLIFKDFKSFLKAPAFDFQ